jgi:hypothetical protein
VSLPDFKSGVAGYNPAGCVRFARAPAIDAHYARQKCQR